MKGRGAIRGHLAVHGYGEARPQRFERRVLRCQTLDQVGDRTAVRKFVLRLGTADGVQGGREAQHPYDQDEEG